MALRLRICSEHRLNLRDRSTVVFGVAGGTIGRSADNDWVLPDPSRFISGRHARVQFRHGTYFFEDTSTNGTFLNDDDQPIPKQTPCELHNGDLLKLGEYQIAVAIDSAAEGAADSTADIELDAAPAAVAVAPEVAAPVATPLSLPDVGGHLGSSLSPEDLFARDGTHSGGYQVGNAFGQAVVLPFGGNRPASNATNVSQAGATGSRPRTESSDIISARRMSRLQRAARRDTAPAGSARAGLEALCRGAGVEPAMLGPDPAAAQILQLAGRLLREALMGLRDIDLHESEVRQRFGLGAQQAEGENPPFNLRLGADELLLKLLQSHDSRRLDAGLWLRGMFEHRKHHEEGLATAGTGAFRTFMQQLEPQDLEERFERSAQRNLMGARPANWDLYKDMYRSLMELPADASVPHTFTEGFAAAYLAATQPEEREK
jgi:type VI secretion system FHA domain protein